MQSKQLNSQKFYLVMKTSQQPIVQSRHWDCQCLNNSLLTKRN